MAVGCTGNWGWSEVYRSTTTVSVEITEVSLTSTKGAIALLMDDSCPLIHVFRNRWEDVHHNQPLTAGGRKLLEAIPNAFLDRSCQVAEAYQIAGKFLIVPALPGNGDIVTRIAGYSPLLTRQWLDIANHRSSARFDVCT